MPGSPQSRCHARGSDKASIKARMTNQLTCRNTSLYRFQLKIGIFFKCKPLGIVLRKRSMKEDEAGIVSLAINRYKLKD